MRTLYPSWSMKFSMSILATQRANQTPGSMARIWSPNILVAKPGIAWRAKVEDLRMDELVILLRTTAMMECLILSDGFKCFRLDFRTDSLLNRCRVPGPLLTLAEFISMPHAELNGSTTCHAFRSSVGTNPFVRATPFRWSGHLVSLLQSYDGWDGSFTSKSTVSAKGYCMRIYF